MHILAFIFDTVVVPTRTPCAAGCRKTGSAKDLEEEECINEVKAGLQNNC